MTGDTEELIDTDYEVIGDWSTNNSMLKRIMNFCDDCKKENLGVIFCQKVVHPTVKKYLYKLNIVLVERIGAQMIPFLLKLSGKIFYHYDLDGMIQILFMYTGRYNKVK